MHTYLAFEYTSSFVFIETAEIVRKQGASL